MINVASLRLVISVDTLWVTNRFETVKFDNKLVEVVVLKPVNHILIHLEFVEMELHSYDIVLFKRLKLLNYIQFIEITTRHVIKNTYLLFHTLYQLSYAVYIPESSDIRSLNICIQTDSLLHRWGTDIELHNPCHDSHLSMLNKIKVLKF